MRTIVLAGALAFGGLSLAPNAYGESPAPMQIPDGAVVIWKAREGEPPGWRSPDGSPPEFEIPDGFVAVRIEVPGPNYSECFDNDKKYSKGGINSKGQRCICDWSGCGWGDVPGE